MTLRPLRRVMSEHADSAEKSSVIGQQMSAISSQLPNLAQHFELYPVVCGALTDTAVGGMVAT